MATSWVINGDDVLYSDMGTGAPFVDGDDFTLTNGSITADQNGNAGGNCTINNLGIFSIDPDVEALFCDGAARTLTIIDSGMVYGNGTSGHNAVIGGNAGTDMNRLYPTSGGIMILNYTTLQYFSGARGIDMVYHAYFRAINCTLSHFSTYILRMYNSAAYFENCDHTDYDTIVIFFAVDYCDLTLVDCAFKSTAGGYWLTATGIVTSVNIVGNNTIDKSGVGPVALDETNDFAFLPWMEVYKFYPKLVLSEGNSLQDCDVTTFHDSMDSNGQFEEGTYKFKFDPVFRKPIRTDGSGDVDLYFLQRVYLNGSDVFYSDSGQAEAGDNQKYTIGLAKDGYSPNTTTAWADSGTASITLSPTPPRTQTNAFPSDQTNDLSKFTTGDTVYLGTSTAGGIEADAAVTNVNVQVEIYNMSDVKQGADLLNTTTTLVADVEKTFYAINSDVLLSRAGLAVGDYYFKITASGGTPSVGTLVSKCYFAVDALVLPQVQINCFPSNQTIDKGGFLPGDTVYVGLSGSGGLTSQINVANANVQIEIYNTSDVKQGADLLNTTATLVATVEKTFYAINSNVLPSRASLAAGDYYIKVTVSGGTPTITSEVSKCYFNINPSQTITNQAHNVADPYSIVIGNNITVTATYTGSDDLWADMNDIYFKLTNTAGSCSGTITTSTVRSGGPYTITVHGPSAVSKDCANPVTITAATEQTSPFVAIEAITETNFVLSGWDTPVVNDKWWKVGEKLIPQIFFDTRHDHYMEWQEMTLPRNATSGVRLHSIFIVVAASTRAERWSMETEIRRIFSDPVLCQEPYEDIDYIYISDGGYSCWESEKDKKSGCATYFSRFEIVVRYADGATNVE